MGGDLGLLMRIRDEARANASRLLESENEGLCLTQLAVELGIAERIDLHIKEAASRPALSLVGGAG